MKFDFIIGNPPYQEDRRGASNTALPIYHSFMESAFEISDCVELISPARFLFNAGRTPKSWNEKMLSDEHFKVLHYEKDASTVFPGQEIKGGVVISYRDKSKVYSPIGIFTVYPELNSILQKTLTASQKYSLESLAFVATKFNTNTLFRDYPDLAGHERRMSSNVLSFPCFHDEKQKNDILVYGIYNRGRCGRFINQEYVDMSDNNLQKFKLVLPKADGNGHFGDTLTVPELLEENSGFTHTFLGIGCFENRSEAVSAMKYIKSKFARALLSVLKVTQDMNADKWKYVPLQDFTPSSDIDWTQSVADIDRQLYRKYGLDETEIAFIESHVKEMA